MTALAAWMLCSVLITSAMMLAARRAEARDRATRTAITPEQERDLLRPIAEWIADAEREEQARWDAQQSPEVAAVDRMGHTESVWRIRISDDGAAWVAYRDLESTDTQLCHPEPTRPNPMRKAIIR